MDEKRTKTQQNKTKKKKKRKESKVKKTIALIGSMRTTLTCSIRYRMNNRLSNKRRGATCIWRIGQYDVVYGRHMSLLNNRCPNM
jgi:hypothetical protein